MPQASWNHLNIALPAVQANGRCNAGSLSPGAWPTSITRLTTAAPVTGADAMPGHRRQAPQGGDVLLEAPQHAGSVPVE